VWGEDSWGRKERCLDKVRIPIPVQGKSVRKSCRLGCAKTAERIDVLFGDSMNIVLDGSPDSPMKKMRGSIRPSPYYLSLVSDHSYALQ